MNENNKTVALKWSAIIRETAEETLKSILPDLDWSSMHYVKLQMLLRESLLKEAEKTILETGDENPSDVGGLLYEIRPSLMEELIPPTTPSMDQAELAMFLMRLLEKEDAFLPLLSETLDNLSSGSGFSKFRITGELLKTSSERFILNVAAAETNKREQKSAGSFFPEGYPYMDKFEYIDHYIAEDDE